MKQGGDKEIITNIQIKAPASSNGHQVVLDWVQNNNCKFPTSLERSSSIVMLQVLDEKDCCCRLTIIWRPKFKSLVWESNDLCTQLFTWDSVQLFLLRWLVSIGGRYWSTEPWRHWLWRLWSVSKMFFSLVKCSQVYDQ